MVVVVGEEGGLLDRLNLKHIKTHTTPTIATERTTNPSLLRHPSPFPRKQSEV